MEKEFMKFIEAIGLHKWVIIWFMTWITKWAFQMRKNDFNLLIFLTEGFLSIVIWYVSWEIVEPKEMLGIYKIIFTAVMSGNAFILTSIVFNPQLFKKILFWFLENKIDINIKDDSWKK